MVFAANCKTILATLHSSDFALIRDQMREAGKAENTIRLHLTIISHLFETARKAWGMEALRNPIQFVTKPGGSTPRERRLARAGQTVHARRSTCIHCSGNSSRVRMSMVIPCQSVVMEIIKVKHYRARQLVVESRTLHGTEDGHKRSVYACSIPESITYRRYC